jgi:hypothetical protein
MWGKRESIAFLVMIVLLAIMTLPSNVEGTMTAWPSVPGKVGGISNIIVKQSGSISCTINGSAHFDVYVMTNDNYNKSEQNIPFAYVQELSRFNVTYAEIKGDVPAGVYAIQIVTLEAGSVTFNGPIVTYPSSVSSIAIPWDTAAIIASTALVSILATYTVMKHRAGKR